jgi:ATP-dependent 26S proteasome regulatory subunit
MLDLVAARAARAIAEAWNSGRLSVPSEDARPFEREVKALLGHVGGFAPELLLESDERLARMTGRSGGRTRATLARGVRLPFVELSREFGLSSVAAHVLMVAMAPTARGEIARLFGILGNDENRPIVDRYLIETVIGGSDRTARAEVARELAEDAPLVRYGLVRVAANDRAPLFGAITVDPVLIERVRGRPTAGGHGDVTTLRKADRTLEQLHIAADVKRDLVLALAARRPDDDPVRVVIRGRRGAGRHSLIAALAARVERGIACIDCHRLPRAGKLMAAALRQELFRAILRGAVPVVSGLEAADPADAEGQDLIKQTLRSHPGPVVIRAAPEASLPLDPGFVTATIPSMSEGERGVFWAEALARAGLRCGDVDAMAARYRVGPGIIEHVISQVVARRAHEAARAGVDGSAPSADDDVSPLLEEVARQHIASRLTHIATHVKRLARWEQVSLPDDAIDSVREFIARIRHRKTVYEQWGFDSKMQTSRGLTALFYGPPGTGTSMVAGLIARELGLDLYRIDLARIVSKWIGETEKNLAEVFDAAEDGQVVILFDEADSLFAKRTEVKSSVDRYANLEVNYLLQRLDTFEGVAILTTNLEGSIDLAFKRRMSLRLHFPFPDEEMRVRLWAAHIPVETPVSGDFDFLELARRFPLSGGYIRNSTLRAAFLAAQENRPLSHEHMVRAIALEYRELGKLTSGGRME